MPLRASRYRRRYARNCASFPNDGLTADTRSVPSSAVEAACRTQPAGSAPTTWG